MHQIRVGEAIKAAIERGEQLRAAAERKPRIRVTPYYGDGPLAGLHILAVIAPAHSGELRAQLGKGYRLVPWAELDDRTGELSGLVEEVVAEVTAAVAGAEPPRPRPSASDDAALDGFEELKERAARSFIEAATLMVRDAHLADAVACEAIMCGAIWAAVLAAHRGQIERDDVRDELQQAFARDDANSAARREAEDRIPAGTVLQ